MNKVAQYLQQHLSGEILESQDVLDYFSTDESILSIQPLLVEYPRSDSDIRKTARFAWQLAEKGKVVPITTRGMGTDLTGASLGSGIILAMPAHLNKIIELDPKTGIVTAEAGISLDKLQQVLHTHGRFLPPISAVNKYGTLGGAVSNNDSGRFSYKYGPIQQFVRGLKVVLSNGEIIETGRITKRELNKKLGLASFEGEIYRSLDKLVEESQDTLKVLSHITDHNSAGFNISDVKQKDGSFDLTPLFVGGQGTLGVIVEVTLDTEAYNPIQNLLIAGFNYRSQAWLAVKEINKLKEGPASLDFIDKSLLVHLNNTNPAILKPLDGSMPEVLIFMDIDDESQRNRKKIIKKLTKLLEQFEADIIKPEDKDVEAWQRLLDSPSMYLTYSYGRKKAVPFLDDAQIPIEKVPEYFKELEGLMQTAGFSEYAVWGQAGNGLIHVAPSIDLGAVGERQKLFKVMSAYYNYICSVGGCISGEYAEGRIRGAFNNLQHDENSIHVFNKIKSIFDPMKIMNPGVKDSTTLDDLKPIIRSEYKLDHQYSYLPRA